ncbi:MAG: zf-HC2 domain-containing protein [Thermoleophilia bacterium]|nr:zf-HC2 domain-containing protein [Thermoleophilia bacterium]
MPPQSAECRRLDALLDRELDGELSREQSEFMRAHLAACGSCRERRAFHSTVRGVIDHALRDEAMPQGMASRMLRRLDEIQDAEEV